MARHQQRPESSRPLINKPPPTRFLFDKHRSLTETLPGQTLNVTLRGSCAAAANLENARINVHSKEIKSRAVTEPPQVDSAEQAVAGLQTKRFSLSSPKEVWSENKKTELSKSQSCRSGSNPARLANHTSDAAAQPHLHSTKRSTRPKVEEFQFFSQ